MWSEMDYSGPVPRQTKEEIDAEIVDAAATLFARFGFRQTSVQAIADEVGYSKAGLLHRFQTKEALWDAVIDDVRTQADAVVDEVSRIEPGPSRDRAAVEALIELTARRSGFIPLVFSMLTTPDDDPYAASLEEIATRALAPFGVSLEDAAEPSERTVRVLGALGAVAITALALEQHPSARQFAVDAALGALGAPRHAASSTA